MRVLMVLIISGWPFPRLNAQANVNEVRIIEQLRAFAKLYGYVRFFHPSDEAAELDWDSF
jgi:hypothetical protein